MKKGTTTWLGPGWNLITVDFTLIFKVAFKEGKIGGPLSRISRFRD